MIESENDRLKIEKQLWKEGFTRIMGLDEVGRGCLAGPVVAAGVIFKPGTEIVGIKDSKKLSNEERRQLAVDIKRVASYWVVKEGSIDDINELNILWASIKTMQRCAEGEASNPDYLLVDGNRYTTSLIPFTCLVKGDDRSMSIGAASIIAKVYRDELMTNLDEEFPEFGWKQNVGYPTPHHKNALKKYGITCHHRTSFKLGTTKKYTKSANDKY